MIVPYVPPWKKNQYAFKPHIDQRVQPGQHWIGRDLDIYNPRRMGILDRQAAAATRERNIASQASQTPQYDHTMGSSAGSAAPTGAAGSSKWKKVIEQLGKMTGPEPDWSLSPQKMGVPSPWSPTNVSWSAVGRPNNEFGVGRTMLDWKKKKGPY